MSNVGIYKITSPSGRIYIGQSWDLKRRFERYRGLETKKQPKLHNSFLKYCVKQHEFNVIHELPMDVTQTILDTYEDIYLCQYRDCGVDLLNTKEAGSHGKHSEETKLKIGVKNKGRYVGVKRSPRTDEHRKNMSLSQKGKKLSPEHLEKNRLSHIGHKHSDETKKKMTLARSGDKNRKSIKVIDTLTGKIYVSCTEAAKEFNISVASLSRYLLGQRVNKTTLKHYTNGS